MIDTEKFIAQDKIVTAARYDMSITLIISNQTDDLIYNAATNEAIERLLKTRKEFAIRYVSSHSPMIKGYCLEMFILINRDLLNILGL